MSSAHQLKVKATMPWILQGESEKPLMLIKHLSVMFGGN